MKLFLNPVQHQILLEVATHRHIALNSLVKALLAAGMKAQSPPHRQDDIRLQIDLLMIYGLIRIEERMTEKMCIATEHVIAWASDHRPSATGIACKQKSSIALPLIAATLVAGMTACANPAGTVPPYHVENPQLPERLALNYNPNNANMVYRFCVGRECPVPTPRKPALHLPVVVEIDASGKATPVEQRIIVSPTTNSDSDAAKVLHKPIDVMKPQPKTATNDKPAAALVSQVDQLRRVSQGEAVGAAQAPHTLPPADTGQVKPPGDRSTTAGRSTPALLAPAPAAAPAVKRGGPLEDMLLVPSSSQRIPDKPHAKAEVLKSPSLDTAATQHHGVAALAASGPVTEDRGTGLDTSAEAFVVAWANLWTAKKADDFFALYSLEFWPSYGSANSPRVFEHQRRGIMSRNGKIKVDVQVVKVDQKGDKASVRFWQQYESKAFKSRVMKSLELVKVDDDWKIRRERLIQLPQNSYA